MIRSILLILLILFTNCRSFCQNLGFGLKTGLNSSTQQQLFKPTGEWEKHHHKLGLKVGVFSAIDFNKHLSLLPTLLYNQKGHIHDLSAYLGPGEFIEIESGYKLRLDYLSLDIPLKLSLSTKSVIPYLLIGPRVDRVFNYKETIKQDPRTERIPRDTYESVYKQYNKWNLGLVTAIGIEYRLGKKMATFFELEYNPDLANAFNNERATIRNTLFALNTGIVLKKN